MKKFILAASLMIAASVSFGQGQLAFANSATTLVTNRVDGTTMSGSTTNLNNPESETQVGLYIGTVGDPSSLALSGNTTNLFSNGRYSGGTRTFASIAPGTIILVQVRAWLATTLYPSYEAAYAAGLGGDVTVMLGQSAAFNVTLTGAPTTPASIVTAGLSPIGLTPVPEPSSIALGLLGLGAVALFRRRK
jgi:hypothetical protein